jgi:beta-phosphoglucomutase
MKYKAIIFDLDGVICHTDQFHFEAWKSIADELGIYFDENINDRLRGVSRMESLDIILEKYEGNLSEQEKMKYATKKNERYRTLLDKMTINDVTNEVRDTLNELRGRGFQLAIGSSSKNAKFILDKVGLADFFDAISDGNHITKSKPDPEVFVKASQYLKIAPEDCLVIEDAIAGIEAATAARMDTAAIGDATNHKIATYNLRSFSEILGLV